MRNPAGIAVDTQNRLWVTEETMNPKRTSIWDVKTGQLIKELVGTTTLFFAAVNVMKVVPYFALGQFSTAGLATSFALFPLAIACNFLGIYLVRVTPEAMFYQITNVIVFLLGLELTRQGVTELMK